MTGGRGASGGEPRSFGPGDRRAPASLDVIVAGLSGRGLLEVAPGDGRAGVHVRALDGSGLCAWIPGAGAQGVLAWLAEHALPATAVEPGSPAAASPQRDLFG